MARISSRVAASSGQGVSRKSYQTARQLGQKGTGSSGALKDVPTSDKRSYSKAADHKPPKEGKFNIDYGDTLPISNLQDLKGFK